MHEGYMHKLKKLRSGTSYFLRPTSDGRRRGGWTGLSLMYEEFDSDLHNERSLICVELRANRDLFPLQGEVAVYGIGIFAIQSI